MGESSNQISKTKNLELFLQNKIGLLTAIGVLFQGLSFVIDLKSEIKIFSIIITIIFVTLVYLFMYFWGVRKKGYDCFLFLMIIFTIFLFLPLLLPRFDWPIKTYLFGEDYVNGLRTKIPSYDITKQIISPSNTPSITSTSTTTSTHTSTSTPTVAFTPSSTFTPSLTSSPTATASPDWGLTNGCITGKWLHWPKPGDDVVPLENGCYGHMDYRFESINNTGLKIDVNATIGDALSGVTFPLTKNASIELRFHIQEIVSPSYNSQTSFYIGFVDSETNKYNGGYYQFQSPAYGYLPALYSLKKFHPARRDELKTNLNLDIEYVMECEYIIENKHGKSTCNIESQEFELTNLEFSLPIDVDSFYIGYEVPKNGRLYVIIDEFIIPNE